MSIKTNELQQLEAILGTDSLLADTAAAGTGRVALSKLAEILVNGNNAVRTALDNKADIATKKKELAESWASLSARIKAGNFEGIHIGDYKSITLATGEVVIMEVAGIDQYYRCGTPEIGHHVDFISRDCLTEAMVFNDTDNNNGTAAEPNPWRASKLFQTLNDEGTGVYAKLPADLKACIIEKRALLESRYSAASALESSTGWAWNNMGKLWLPTEVEVFGCTFWADGKWTGGGGCNLQYPIFRGGSKRLIKGAGNGGSRRPWWEANAVRQSSTQFCDVGFGGGSADYITATYDDMHAPICFRI